MNVSEKRVWKQQGCEAQFTRGREGLLSVQARVGGLGGLVKRRKKPWKGFQLRGEVARLVFVETPLGSLGGWRPPECGPVATAFPKCAGQLGGQVGSACSSDMQNKCGENTASFGPLQVGKPSSRAAGFRARTAQRGSLQGPDLTRLFTSEDTLPLCGLFGTPRSACGSRAACPCLALSLRGSCVAHVKHTSSRVLDYLR